MKSRVTVYEEDEENVYSSMGTSRPTCTPKQSRVPLCALNLNGVQQYISDGKEWRVSSLTRRTGMETIRGPYQQQLLDTLEMDCRKEQVRVDSYARMVEQLHEEIEQLQLQNDKVYSRIQQERLEVTSTEQQLARSEQENLLQMEKLLDEIQQKQINVRQMMAYSIQTPHEDLEQSKGRVMGIQKQVNYYYRKISEDETKRKKEIEAMAEFIRHLQRQRDELYEEIECMDSMTDRSSRNIMVQDRQDTDA